MFQSCKLRKNIISYYSPYRKIHHSCIVLKCNQKTFNTNNVKLLSRNIKPICNSVIMQNVVGEREKEIILKIIRLIKEDKYDRALKECDIALKENSSSAMIYGFKAGIYQKFGKYDEGLKYIDLAIKYGDEELFPRYISLKAELLCNVERYDEGLKLIDKAIKLGVEPSSMYILKGEALCDMYYATGEKDISLVKKAVKYFNKVLQVEPNNIKTMLDKGEMLFELEKYNESIKCFDHVLAIDPNNEQALENKACILYHMGEHDKSIKYCRKLIKIGSNNPHVQYSLSRTLYNLDLIPEALDAINAVIKLDPSLPNSKRIKKLFEGLLDKS